MEQRLYMDKLFRSLNILLSLCKTGWGWVCCLLFIFSCQQSETIYCNLPARFTMENIYQAPALYTACNSMGEFCTITAQGSTFVFTGSKITSTVNRTALNDYAGFYLGLSGFIVGLPYIPEMGKDQSQIVCFDLACSNCYHDFTVTKRMTIKDGGFSYCSSCHRTYDLNNLGLISDGEAGKPLFRYRVNLIGNTLVIANR